MESITLSSLDGSIFFTSGMPNVTIPGTNGTPKQVTIVCDNKQLLNESLWPTEGAITLTSLGEMLEPYAKKQLVCSVTITAGEDSSTCTILYAMVDVGISASEFYTGHFLSTLMGTKITAKGRLEYLWYYGNGSASITAEYADGSTQSFNAVVCGGTSVYTQLDVSPDNFVVSNKQLVAYTVTAGNRSQRFEMDMSEPDCAPILEFYNSFGVWELFYCTGTHKVNPKYERSSARFGGMMRNYKVKESREFQADTGIMNTAMANWADDLFRSEEVYVINVINGEMTSQDGGREVFITDSKSENRNDNDFMPRFTFSYQYSQRIHNVLQVDRVGRIFDNTFDHTFN